MASVKCVIHKHRKKADGTFAIYVRLSHQRKVSYIKTGKFATESDFTKDLGAFKKGPLKDSLDSLILEYRKIINSLESINSLIIEDIESYLSINCNNNSRYSFYSYADRLISNMLESGRVGNSDLYKYVINSLKKYWPLSDLHFDNIDVKFLKNYESHLRKKSQNHLTSRSVSLYLSVIRAIFNSAMKELNKPHLNIVPIPYNPFDYYSIPKYTKTSKRALKFDFIKAIYDLPLEGKSKRYVLARDIFILSFGLIGMNSADLYSCSSINENVLTYYREKTKTRRSDKAEMQVRIEDHIQDLFAKYRDSSGKFVFDFYKRYSDFKAFNKAVNIGLKSVGKDIGIENLQLYAARHSWATIATNDLKVDKYSIHIALNHIDVKTSITDVYITRDWTMIWDINKRLLDYVLKIDKQASQEERQYFIQAVFQDNQNMRVFSYDCKAKSKEEAYTVALTEFRKSYTDCIFPVIDSDHITFLTI